MERLWPLPARKVIKKLKQAGFVETHQRGSHLYLENTTGRVASVPVHGGAKDLPVGTLYNIVIHQAGLTAKEFNKL